MIWKVIKINKIIKFLKELMKISKKMKWKKINYNDLYNFLINLYIMFDEIDSDDEIFKPKKGLTD